LLKSLPKPASLNPEAAEAVTFSVEYVLRELGAASISELGRGARKTVFREHVVSASARMPGLAFLRMAFDALANESGLGLPTKRAITTHDSPDILPPSEAGEPFAPGEAGGRILERLTGDLEVLLNDVADSEGSAVQLPVVRDSQPESANGEEAGTTENEG